MLLTACPAPGGMAPAVPASAEPELVPRLVGAAPERASATTTIRPSLPSAGPSSPASPRASARPTATLAPTPMPAPKNLERSAFRLTVPAGWTVTSDASDPVAIVLTRTSGSGRFELRGQPAGNVTLAKRQTQLEEAAGPGVVKSESALVDGLRGVLVASNQDRDEGKRYVMQRGFIYRDTYWVLTTMWDKRAPEAAAVEAEATAWVRAFIWL
jgi:hypothetical protein